MTDALAAEPAPDPQPSVPAADPAAPAPGIESPGWPLVEVKDLEVHFPIRGGFMDTLRRRPRGYVRAVDGIDLKLLRGEVLALVGESGSGKTTTGRVIVKLTKQTGGTITVDGTDVTGLWGAGKLKKYRRRVQLIFQDPYETLNP